MGAIDGCITTFAVVSSVVGAQLSREVVIILGLANLAADGVSMAVSNYQRAKSEREHVAQARRAEERHIQEVPHGEREELRQIFARKGFTGAVLEEIVAVISEDRRRWVNTMLTEELGLRLHGPRPLTAAFVTFAGFVGAGLIPLLPFLFVQGLSTSQYFTTSACAAGAAFFVTGLLQGRMVARSPLVSGLETLLTGGAAAVVAYFAGAWLQGVLGLRS